MAKTTLPVGSVVETGHGKALIVGCTFTEKNDKMKKTYMIVPYPAGYAGEDSLRLIEAENVQLVSDGYHGMLCEAYTKYMDVLEAAADMTDAATFKREMEKVERRLGVGEGGEA